MSVFLLIGFITLLIAIPYLVKRNKPNKLFHLLVGLRFSHNPWRFGLLVALGNLIIFGSVIVMYLLAIVINLGILILLIAIIGIVASIWYWIQIGVTWSGTTRDRVIMSLIGSVFYWLLLITFMYMYLTLTPQFEGDDTFMAAIGLFIGMIISITAALCNISIILYCGKVKEHTKNESERSQS